LAGQPSVPRAVQPTSPDAELAARLWDVAPDGTQTLMARGVYRLAGTPVAPAGDVAFGLSANAWRLPAGDQLKLEVAGADAPYFQPDTVPSATAISSVDLELPLAEGAPQPAQVASAAPSRAGGPGASAPAELAATGAP